jgi:hypothetical protein
MNRQKEKVEGKREWLMMKKGEVDVGEVEVEVEES